MVDRSDAYCALQRALFADARPDEAALLSSVGEC
jgi:hypothetical protein